MRKLMASVLLGVLLSTVGLAQETDRQSKLAPFLRLMDAAIDMQMLATLASLQLTDAQLQSFAAVYKQYPPPQPDIALVQKAVDLVMGLRARLLAGGLTALPPDDAQAMQKAVEQAFSQFPGGAKPDQQPFTGLTPAETLLWAILTPTQQGLLLKTGDPTQRVLSAIRKRGGDDEPTWSAFRDKLASALSAGTGEVGTPGRDNRRQMLVDFLNRLRKMSDADFVNKQKELNEELGALLPGGVDLVQVLAGCDPLLIHETLATSLLSSRAADLLAEMQAARAKKAEH